MEPGTPDTLHQLAAQPTDANPMDPPPAFCNPSVWVSACAVPGVAENESRSLRMFSCGTAFMTVRFTLKICELPTQGAGD